MTGTMTWAAMDVHARSTYAASLDVTSGELVRRRFDTGAVEPVVGWLAGLPGPERACYEAGPTGFGLYEPQTQYAPQSGATMSAAYLTNVPPDEMRFGLLIVQPACLQLVAGVARLFGSQTLAGMTAARRFSSRATRDPYLSRAG